METNFYKYSGINQNLTFDKIYASRLEMIAQQGKYTYNNSTYIRDDGIFPKRLVLINYFQKPSNWSSVVENGEYSNDEQGYYKYNQERDYNNFRQSYDSTVWQKVRGKLSHFSEGDEIDDSLDLYTDEEGWIYQQIADLDSIAIEINPLNLNNETQASILVGIDSEGKGAPIYAGSFLDVIKGSEESGDFYVLNHEKSIVGEDYIFNAFFDSTNKKIYIDNPTFDVYGHLKTKGLNEFYFSVVGDEDKIMSNYNNNIITLSHKNATFSTTAIKPTWEEKSLYIPQLTFDEQGHINLNTNNFLQIKFQSDGTYITNENLTYGIKFNHKAYEEGNSLASITADMNTGVFTFKIPNVKRDSGGHISDLDALETSIQVDNDILKLQTVNGKYEIYHNYSGHDSEVISPATGINVIYLPILEFDDKGHIIQTDANDLMISLDTEDLQLIESSMNPNSFTIAHKDYETINDIDTIISKKIKTSENDAYNPSRSDFIDISQEPQYEDLRYSFYSVLDLQSSFTANSSATGNSAGEIITIFDSKGNVLKTWTYTANDGLIIEKTISIHYVHTDPNELLTLSLSSVGEGTRYGISIINNATNFRVYTTPKRSVIKTPVINFNKTGHFKDHEEQEFVTLEFDYNQFSIASIEDSRIIVSLSQTLLDRIGQLEARIAELENK